MSQTATINLELNRPQSKAFRLIGPGQRVNLAWGRGVGKSWFDRQVGWLLTSQRQSVWRHTAPRRYRRGIRIVYLMPTLKQFKDVHGDGIRNEVADDWAFLGGKLDKTTYRIEFPWGGWMQPFPAAAASSRTARGLRCDVVIGDEVDDIDPSTWASVIKPWFSEPWSFKLQITSGTPRRGRKGLLYKFHELGLSDDPDYANYHTVHATYKDAPETVDADEVEDARRTTPQAVFEREWECNFDSAEGLVYSEFDEQFHVRPPPADIRWNEILIVADHGYEDPGVLLLIGVLGHGEDATLWVLDEIYERHQTEDWWCDRLSAWTNEYPHHYFYGDPSQPARIKAFQKKARSRPRPVNNDIHDGVMAVARLIRKYTEGDELKAHLYVSPRCKKTIWEFGSYKRRPDKDDKDLYTEDIIDKDNHAMDALRYGVLSHLGKISTSRGSVDMGNRFR